VGQLPTDFVDKPEINIHDQLGRIAYEVYSVRVGDPMQLFDDLPEEVRGAWIAVADAIRTETTRPRRELQLGDPPSGGVES
jgi:hypothetical protein